MHRCFKADLTIKITKFANMLERPPACVFRVENTDQKTFVFQTR